MSKVNVASLEFATTLWAIKKCATFIFMTTLRNITPPLIILSSLHSLLQNKMEWDLSPRLSSAATLHCYTLVFNCTKLIQFRSCAKSFRQCEIFTHMLHILIYSISPQHIHMLWVTHANGQFLHKWHAVQCGTYTFSRHYHGILRWCNNEVRGIKK